MPLRITYAVAAVFALVLVIDPVSSGSVTGAEEARPLDIGDRAPGFSLPGVDGREYSLEDFARKRVLVVVFTCNHCPTAQAYEERLKKMASDYEDRGVALVAISPNDPEAVRLDELGYTDLGDSLEEMKTRAKHRNFNFPYLYDGETQKASKAYGPKSTPHVFVFDAERRLRYTGRVDSTESGRDIESHDTRNAIEALLAGKPVEVERTRVFGCSVKWSDKRAAKQAFMKKLSEEKVSLDEIDVDGVHKLKERAGKRLLLVNVWATWCGPCRVEFPDLVTSNRMYRHRDFEFVTISVDGSANKKAVLDFLENEQASNRNFIYGRENLDALAEALDPEWSGALPFTVLFEPGGQKSKVRYRHEGQIDPLELRRSIVAFLGRTYR